MILSFFSVFEYLNLTLQNRTNKITEMKKIATGILAIILLATTAVAQQSLSEDIVFKIKREAFQNSKIETLAFFLTDYAGPRLSASKLGVRSELLVKDKLEEMGFSNVRIEKATDFPQGGWDNLKTYVAMTAPYYSHFMALPTAWTGSTNGLVQGEVILLDIKSAEDIGKYKGKLANKIVLMPEMYRYAMRFTPLARRFTDEQLEELTVDHRVQAPSPSISTSTVTSLGAISWQLQQQIRSLLAEEKPAVIIEGAGSFNVPPASTATYRYGSPEPVAELRLPIEAHGRMVRLISQGIPVSMEVEIKNEFYNNQFINNVIAEIPGTDPKLKDEVVLIGAHLDSYHGSTGAADNAAGCAIMIEALRIIKEIGVQPRRTLRIALWGGEEQGLLGSRGYMQNFLYDVNANKPREGYDRFALYLNTDNGSGKVRGIWLEENDMAFPFFREWNRALETFGFGILSPRKNGGMDHVSFDQIGLPSFSLFQDLLEYGRGYHNMMDTYERLIITDMQYNAVIIATLALSAAMDNGRIPPKPLPAGFSLQRRL